MAPTARELLQRREDQRKVDELRAALTRLRAEGVQTDDEVLTDWSRGELARIGRTGSTPDASLDEDADAERLTAWLSALEQRSELGARIFLGTSLRTVPWLDCEVIAPGWLAEARAHVGGDLRALSADRRRLLVVFDEEHEIECFLRTAPSEPVS
jgi:hypothetical protein